MIQKAQQGSLQRASGSPALSRLFSQVLPGISATANASSYGEHCVVEAGVQRGLGVTEPYRSKGSGCDCRSYMSQGGSGQEAGGRESPSITVLLTTAVAEFGDAPGVLVYRDGS